MLLKNKRSISGAKMFRFGIVASEYNRQLCDSLLAHTVSTLEKAGARKITSVRVPGCYEIPLIVSKLAGSKKFNAIIALGVVFQGKTSHAEHITLAAAIHLQKISLESGVPVIHQILTPKNLGDARARVKIRGVEAAQTALAMAKIVRELKK